jgi:GNAT superfamily N-acetyltransferase
MSDEWMPTLKMKLARADFERLPRHPSYKYELIDGETWISPWPRYGHAQLQLSRFRPDADDLANLALRKTTDADQGALASLFCAAFGRLQPYGSLDDATRESAAAKALAQTFSGGDGPFVEAASYVALMENEIVGAILITLVPGGADPDGDNMLWQEPPPANLWENRGGQPHLTWILVHQMKHGRGVGTQLLLQSVRVLKKHGYKTLWSTFLIGNESSVLWHWRNGFELLPHLLSRRRMRRELHG